MNISVLLPSRNNVENLIQTVDSLFNTASHPDDIEILIGVDFDDPVIETVRTKFENYKNTRIIIFEPRYGYTKLNKYLNDLSRISEGEFLFFANDDMTMKTQGWDNRVMNYSGKLRVLRFDVIWIDERGTSTRNDLLFPLVSKKWVEATGEFSGQAHNDSYIGSVLGNLEKLGIDILERNTGVFVEHDMVHRYAGVRNGNVMTTEEFFGEENTFRMKVAAQKLKDYIVLHPECL